MTKLEKRVVKAAMRWFNAQERYHKHYRQRDFEATTKSIAELKEACAELKKANRIVSNLTAEAGEE